MDSATSDAHRPAALGAAWSERIPALLWLAAQLGLVWLLLARFRLESATLRGVALAAFGGALVHALLPARQRLPFFVGLSLATTCWVVGLARGEWSATLGLSRLALLVALGLGLAWIARWRGPWAARAGALALAAAALALFRAGVFQFSTLDAIWPVLGSMFMFRLLLYFYDAPHEKEPPDLMRTLAYFFLLPNACLPLFPVIDYKTFWRTYLPAPRPEVAQRGVEWMLRGITHLLLWRLVYYQLYLDPSRVRDGGDLIQYVLTNIALYLRVSGQFHFVIGLLHLFGFDLPEANKRYFLASSFTDYWRRVNIYWKDFIMKLFYYPAVFRLKAWGPRASLIAATLFAFVLTWALHSYQWFWLRGDFPVRAQDVVFWSALMVLVIANSLLEASRGRKRSLGALQRGPRDWLVLAAKTGGTFAVVTFLWSMWTADSLAQFVAIWALADGTTAWVGGAALVVVMIASVVSAATAPAPSRPALGASAPAAFAWRPALSGVVAPACALLALSSSHVVDRLPATLREPALSLAQTKPNKSDEEFLVRGYYEDLMDTSRFSSLLSDAEAARPADWRKLEDTDAIQPIADLRTKGLVPGRETLVNGQRVRANSHGMRDREYALAKPAGTTRIALLGSSIEMAWGTDASSGFESKLEARLNAARAARGEGPVEILNFALNGYGPLAQVDVFRKQVLAFEPDALLVFGHPEDHVFLLQQLQRALRMGVPLEDAPVRDALARAGIDATTPEADAGRRLEPFLPELLAFADGAIAGPARERGMQLLWVYLPGRSWSEPTALDALFKGAARDAGFTVLTLEGVLARADVETTSVALWDGHPNAAGHALLEQALWEALEQAGALDFKARAGATPVASAAHPDTKGGD